MKKNFFNFVCTLMMMVVSMSFVSCGDDDNDSSEGGGGSSTRDSELVGTWVESSRASYGTLYFGFLFQSNGSGYYNEWDSKDPETPQDGTSLTWSTADGILTIVMSGEKPETYKYVLSSNKKTLTLYDVSNGSVLYTLAKQ